MDPEVQTIVAESEAAVLVAALRTTQAGLKARRKLSAADTKRTFTSREPSNESIQIGNFRWTERTSQTKQSARRRLEDVGSSVNR